jgi:hypothetical protein
MIFEGSALLPGVAMEIEPVVLVFAWLVTSPEPEEIRSHHPVGSHSPSRGTA